MYTDEAMKASKYANSLHVYIRKTINYGTGKNICGIQFFVDFVVCPLHMRIKLSYIMYKHVIPSAL